MNDVDPRSVSQPAGHDPSHHVKHANQGQKEHLPVLVSPHLFRLLDDLEKRNEERCKEDKDDDNVTAMHRMSQWQEGAATDGGDASQLNTLTHFDRCLWNGMLHLSPVSGTVNSYCYVMNKLY